MTAEEARDALRALQKDRRDEIVRQAHAAGLNVNEISRESGISRTTIYKIVALSAGAAEYPVNIDILNSFEKHRLTQRLAGEYVRTYRLCQDGAPLPPDRASYSGKTAEIHLLLDEVTGGRVPSDRAITGWLRQVATEAEAAEARDERRMERPARVDAAVEAWFALRGEAARDEAAIEWLRPIVMTTTETVAGNGETGEAL